MVPHYLHADLTERIAEAGKQVLCEKPRLARFKNAIEWLKSQKNHRFLPVHQYIKKLPDKDYIGDVFLAR